MAIHRFEAEPKFLHGSVSRDFDPIARVASGDIVQGSCLDSRWHALVQPDPFGKLLQWPDPEPGHCLTGPVFIEGVQPGDTVEVEIAELKTARYGWTAAGGPTRPVHEWVHTASHEPITIQYRIDPERGILRTEEGIELGLAPFMGWIGLAPAEEGAHSTDPPRRTGGNIDCRELQKGARLFLPAEVEGGLLFFGDAHARQGDGEVAGPAIETGVEHLSLVIRRHEGQTLSNPFAYTALGYVTFGFSENLEEAAFEALNQMLTLMEISFGLTRPRAQALCSAVLSIRVTQVVNGTKGCHAILPWELIHQLQ